MRRKNFFLGFFKGLHLLRALPSPANPTLLTTTTTTSTTATRKSYMARNKMNPSVGFTRVKRSLF